MNIEMFLTAKEVEESLERRETATCLAWCHDNKSRLRKMKVCGAPSGRHSRCDRVWWEGWRRGRGSATCPRTSPLLLLVQSSLVLVHRVGCLVWCGSWVVLVVVFAF